MNDIVANAGPPVTQSSTERLHGTITPVLVLPRVVWQSLDGNRRAVLVEIEDDVVARLVVECRDRSSDAMGQQHWRTNIPADEAYGFGVLEPAYVAELLGLNLDAETQRLQSGWNKRAAEGTF